MEGTGRMPAHRDHGTQGDLEACCTVGAPFPAPAARKHKGGSFSFFLQTWASSQAIISVWNTLLHNSVAANTILSPLPTFPDGPSSWKKPLSLSHPCRASLWAPARSPLAWISVSVHVPSESAALPGDSKHLPTAWKIWLSFKQRAHIVASPLGSHFTKPSRFVFVVS